MALDFVCGWECGRFGPGATTTPDQDHWDSNGTVIPTVDDTLSDFRLHIVSTGGGSSHASKTIARTVLVQRFYVEFASFASTTFMRITNANGNLDIDIDASGNVTAVGGTQAGTRTATIKTLAVDTEYLFDVVSDTSTGTATIKVSINGEPAVTASNTQASANMTAHSYGNRATVTIEMWFNHLITGTALSDWPFGPGFVSYYFPNADGTHSFTAGDFGHDAAGTDVGVSDTNVWVYLGNRPLTSTTQFIRQKVIRSTGYVEIDFASSIPANYSGSHDAQAINVVAVFHANGTGANTFGMKLNDGGTLRDCLDDAGDNLMDVSQTTLVCAEDVVVTPPSGGVWTKAKLDAMKIRAGFSTDVVAIPYIDDVLIEVAWASPKLRAYRNPMPQLLAQ